MCLDGANDVSREHTNGPSGSSRKGQVSLKTTPLPLTDPSLANSTPYGLIRNFASMCEHKISRSCFSNFNITFLLLSKWPSRLLKLSKGVVFTPIASTDARGMHRHQAIVTLSLYHSKRRGGDSHVKVGGGGGGTDGTYYPPRM